MDQKLSTQTKPNQTEPNKTEQSSKFQWSDEPVMATIKTDDKPSTATGGKIGGVWDNAVPAEVTPENRVSTTVSNANWARLYSRIGAASASEDSKRGIRGATYVYCAINGTSRSGDYTTDLKTSDGLIFNASHIPAACGKNMARKWMRANAIDSYEFFAATRCLQAIPSLAMEADKHGSNSQHVIGLCDWMGDCPLLTAGERKLHDAAFDYNIRRARAARGNRSLESVENEYNENALHAQGEEEHGRVIQM